jgi:hypothetical protein
LTSVVFRTGEEIVWCVGVYRITFSYGSAGSEREEPSLRDGDARPPVRRATETSSGSDAVLPSGFGVTIKDTRVVSLGSESITELSTAKMTAFFKALLATGLKFTT